MLCLVVEFLGDEDELPRFTRTNRGATIDLMAEPGGGDLRHALLLVRNAPWPALQALVAELQRTRAPVTTLRVEAAEELWFGRITFDSRKMQTPTAKVIGGLVEMLGPPWVHIESGVVHLRATIRDPVHAEDVLHLIQEGLRAEGVDAQAVVQEVARKDHSVWESLVRHGIGMNL